MIEPDLSVSLQATLRKVAANYARSATWADKVFDVWAEQLEGVDPPSIEAAGLWWIRNQERLPTLSGFLEALRNIPGSGKADPQGCPDCTYCGQRQIAHHYKARKGHAVVTYAAACSCELGLFYQRSPHLPPWDALRDALMLKYSTVAVYVTDQYNPALPRHKQYAPDVLERLDNRPGMSNAEARAHIESLVGPPEGPGKGSTPEETTGPLAGVSDTGHDDCPF